MNSHKDTNEILDVFRLAHASVAKYSLKVINENSGGEETIKKGLQLDVAMTEAQELNRQYQEGLTGVFCIPVIENAEEARAAVKIAAEVYWIG